MASPISETTIRHHATSSSLSRGEDYYQRGAVTDLVQRGNTICAAVEGSEVTPYRISLQFDSGGIMAVRCTCPYDYEGWCKHIVAVALFWVRQPDRVELRPTLPQLLDRLNHVQMQRLVQALVEDRPELIDVVDRCCDAAVQSGSTSADECPASSHDCGCSSFSTAGETHFA